MKKIICLLSLFVVTVCIQVEAQEKQVLQLWENGLPEEEQLVGAVKVEAENEKEIPNLTVYLPKKPNGKAIIMCPGGAYGMLAIDHEGHAMADWFTSQGIAYCVLKYRLPGGRSTIPFTDAERAIQLVREHAAEWNINPKAVGVMGASAGGHLASTLATHFTSDATRPDFQILLYPVITMNEEFTHKGSKFNLLGETPTEEQVAFYSNETRVTKNTPPAFIALSSDDKAVLPINSLLYYKALIRYDIPVALFSYPIGGHGWGFNDQFIYKREWTQELEKWLRELE